MVEENRDMPMEHYNTHYILKKNEQNSIKNNKSVTFNEFVSE